MNFDDLERAFFDAIYESRIPIGIGSVVAAVGLLLVARRLRWFDAARRRPVRTGALLVVVLAIGLPLGWYLVSPVFIRTELVEPDPIAAAQLLARPSPSQAVPQASGAPASSGPVASSQPVASSGPVVIAGTATAAPTASPFIARTTLTGSFSGTDDFHFGRGTARIIETAPGAYVLRFENFSVRNGPDLYVYLSPNASGYDRAALELGTLKATDGSFGYALPAGTDPADIKSAIIWCKQFSHLFAVAPLDPPPG